MAIIRVRKPAVSEKPVPAKQVKAVEPKTTKLSDLVLAAIANIELGVESGDTSLLTDKAIPQLRKVVDRLLY